RISLLPDGLYDLLLKCQRIFFPSASLLFVNLPESLRKLFGLPGNPLFFFLSFCFLLIFLPVSVLSFHGNTAPRPGKQKNPSCNHPLLPAQELLSFSICHHCKISSRKCKNLSAFLPCVLILHL